MTIKFTTDAYSYKRTYGNGFVFFIEDVLLLFADDDVYWDVADNLCFIGDLN